jgi:hypothetical protein
MCFSAIKQYIKDKSNSKDRALNNFNLEVKLTDLFKSILEK